MGEKSFEYDLQKLGRKGTIADTYSRYSNISCMLADLSLPTSNIVFKVCLRYAMAIVESLSVLHPHAHRYIRVIASAKQYCETGWQ